MSDTFKKLSKSTAVLSGANAIQAAAGLILLPIYTRYLTPADYGLAELLITTITLSTILIGQGLPSAVQRQINFSHRDDPSGQNLSVSTAMVYLLVCGIIACAIIAVLRVSVSEWTTGSPDYGNLVLVGLAVTLGRGLKMTCDTALRAHFRAFSVSVVRLVDFLARAGVILYLLMVAGWGFESLIYGLAASEIISVLLSLVLSARYLVPRFSAVELRKMLAYGVPLLGSAAAFFVLNLSNRYFLNFLADPTEVGLYSIADRLANAINLLIFIPLVGFIPAAYFEIAKREPDAAPGKFSRFATQFVAGGSLLVAGMLLFADIVIENLFTEAYHEASKAVGLISFGYFLFAASELTKFGINIKAKTMLLPLRGIIGALANIALNFLLVPDFGFIGAAIAGAISYGVLWIVGLRFSQRLFPVPYETGKILLVALGGILVAIGYLVTQDMDMLTRFGTRVGLFILYGGYLLITGILEPSVLLRVVRSPNSEPTQPARD